MSEREDQVAARISAAIGQAVRIRLSPGTSHATVGWRGIVFSAPIDKHGEDHFVALATEALR